MPVSPILGRPLERAFRLTARSQLGRLAAIYEQNPAVLNSVDPETGSFALYESVQNGHAEGAVYLLQRPGLKLPQEKDVEPLLFERCYYALYEIAKHTLELNRKVSAFKFISSALQPQIIGARQAEMSLLRQIDSPEKIVGGLKACETFNDFQKWFDEYKIDRYPYLTIDGETLFHYGIYISHIDTVPIVKFLLQRKMDINTQKGIHDLAGYQSPILHTFLANGTLHEFLPSLGLAKGKVNFSQTDGEEKTLLHMAVKMNLLEIVNLLLMQMKNAGMSKQEISAIINKVDIYGVPLLHIAFILGNKEILKLLIGHGADIHIKDFCGQTLKDIIKSSSLDLRAHSLLALVHTDSGRDAGALWNYVSVPNDANGFYTLRFHGAKYLWTAESHYRTLSQLAAGEIPDGIRLNPNMTCNKRELDGFTNKMYTALENIRMHGKTMLQTSREGRAEIMRDPQLMQLLDPNAPIAPPRVIFVPGAG